MYFTALSDTAESKDYDVPSLQEVREAIGSSNDNDNGNDCSQETTSNDKIL
jgi:hypothetical protein